MPCLAGGSRSAVSCHGKKKKKQIGHHARPRRASATAPLRTCAKQDQPQASAPGQNRTQFVGGTTTHGRRTRQAGKSVPTQTRPGAGGCTPPSTPQEGTLQQDPNTLASCAKGTYGLCFPLDRQRCRCPCELTAHAGLRACRCVHTFDGL